MKLVTGLVALALAASVQAQQFPTKRVAFVSGVTPGSASDTMARILAEKLQQKWGQTVIVEDGGHNANNRPYRYRSRTADWLAAHFGLPKL